MVQEFKDFIMKGNLLEIAVGLIMALSFAAVVDSFVEHIITPIVGAIFGLEDFANSFIEIGDAKITYGAFINAVLSFVTVAFVMFMLVKAYNRVNAAKEEDEGPSDNDLLVEIRDALRQRA